MMRSDRKHHFSTGQVVLLEAAGVSFPCCSDAAHVRPGVYLYRFSGHPRAQGLTPQSAKAPLRRFETAGGQATAMQPALGVVHSPVVVHARLPVHCRALRCDHHMVPALPATHLHPSQR